MASEDQVDEEGAAPLTVEELRTVEGIAREDRPAACPACGRPVASGQEVVTSLGDVRRGAIGVTVHARCFSAIGRVGLLELMRARHGE